MAPWVQRVFIDILPKILCIERPKKEEDENEQHQQSDVVLTDVNVFQVPPDVDKYGFCGNRYSTDYDIPGEYFFFLFIRLVHLTFKSRLLSIV